jgi:hypothetical protein
MPEQWPQYQQVLLDSSRRVIKTFLSQHTDDKLLAIGFVFELWNNTPQFDLCAHTGDEPSEDPEVRWNSGDYSFPARLLGLRDELGPEWTAINTHLHQLAKNEDESGEIYQGLIDISIQTMIALKQEGFFGKATHLDFNISEVGDALETVRERNQMIHAKT